MRETKNIKKRREKKTSTINIFLALMHIVLKYIKERYMN